MTTVSHVKNPTGLGEVIYVGRPTKWGNPFKIGVDGDRDEVCNKYAEYIQTRPDLLSALPELQNKVLTCWCYPLRCHADTLAKLANTL